MGVLPFLRVRGAMRYVANSGFSQRLIPTSGEIHSARLRTAGRRPAGAVRQTFES